MSLDVATGRKELEEEDAAVPDPVWLSSPQSPTAAPPREMHTMATRVARPLAGKGARPRRAVTPHPHRRKGTRPPSLQWRELGPAEPATGRAAWRGKAAPGGVGVSVGPCSVPEASVTRPHPRSWVTAA